MNLQKIFMGARKKKALKGFRENLAVNHGVLSNAPELTPG
jgi:hypothetical protein